MQGTDSEEELHGTCVAAPTEAGNWAGLLILGPSGVGKSALALSLIARGARLVADDRVRLSSEGSPSTVQAAPSQAHEQTGLTGVIEARGVGLIQLTHVKKVRLQLVCRLMEDQIDLEKHKKRLPLQRSINICNCTLPMFETRYSSELADAFYCLLHCGVLLDPEATLGRANEDGRR